VSACVRIIVRDGVVKVVCILEIVAHDLGAALEIRVVVQVHSVAVSAHCLLVPALGHVAPCDGDNSVIEVGVKRFECRRRHI